MEKIGFIGLGNMGPPIAKNIEKSRFPLSRFNESLEKPKVFQEKSTIYTEIKRPCTKTI